MSLPTTFANNTSPTGLQLDNDLLAVAAMGITNCTAVGTNTITLTLQANQPAVGAYVNNTRFDFVAVATSSGSVTLQVGSLSPLPVYKPGGSQAGSGDIVNGSYYEIVFLQALNSGVGGFQIASALPASAVTPVAGGSVRGLAIINNVVTPNTKVTIAATNAVLVTSAGSPLFVASVGVVIDLTTTGANGMDTGARPTSGWVYLYIISNGSVTAGLATATSPTAGTPTMPGGYSYLVYVGAMFCDGSQNLMRTRQLGKNAQYVVTSATNTAALPAIISGSSGSITVPTFTAAAITGFVPLSAGEVSLALSGLAFNSTGAVSAPNNSYGAYNSATNPPPLVLFSNAAASSNQVSQMGKLVLESTNVYYASNAASGLLQCAGWTDYYVNA